MTRALVAVPSREPTLGEKIASRRAELGAAVDAHVAEMQEAFTHARTLACEVANGGSLYHHGVREIARQEAERLKAALDNLQRIGGAS